MDQQEKWKTAAIAMSSGLKAHAFKATSSPSNVVDLQTVNSIINDWPALSKKSANLTINRYGPPNEAISSRLIWYKNGPWKRTIVYQEEIPHDFPQPHSDVIENVIDYQVPPEKFTELAKFDGSVIIERTKGEVSSRCDMEEANIIALNLMHDIVTGKMDAQTARDVYCEVTSAFMLNRSAPYAEKLQFEIPTNTRDTDQIMIVDEMAREAVEKVKDIVSGEQQEQKKYH
ncbi:hypothetical protein [Halalkalibacter urbisdiaboli]|uniref:hypothetical protein n=1 Tax=Halalkalibacter urbisdiaboli TaxID=1960589 RepID=UPI000B454A59|nr:hypothetical protein [Halalkalibacter urbisdiaboli]